MPDRTYPLGPRPSIVERFAANAAVTLLSAWWVIFGLELLYEGLLPGKQTTSAISHFPNPAPCIIGTLFIVGGLISIWGVYTEEDDLGKVWQWRKVGFTAAMLAGGAYAFFTTLHDPLELVALSFGFMHLTIGLGGIAAIIITEKHERGDRAGIPRRRWRL